MVFAFSICLPSITSSTLRIHHSTFISSTMKKPPSFPILTKNHRTYPLFQPNETTYLLDDSSFETQSTTKIQSSDSTTDLMSTTTPTSSSQLQLFSPGLEGNTPPLNPRVLFAEFLCTFLFCFLSVTSSANPNTLASAFNNAGVVAALAASYMPVSGAHLNPAITFALLLTKRLHWKRALAFVPIQIFACTTASFLVQFLGVPVTFPGIALASSATQTFRATAFEFMAMFIITAVVFQTAVATEQEGGTGKNIAAVYIGLIVLACAGSFSPAVFNPARAAGPAIVAHSLHQHWVYWIGPLLGAGAAGLISEHIFIAPAGKRKPKSILTDIFKKTATAGDRLKSLGVAGIISYGIMNTLYYGVAFTYMMSRVGFSSGPAGVTKAWIVTWSLSQVTKPLRLGLSILLAPFVDKALQKWRARRRD